MSPNWVESVWCRFAYLYVHLRCKEYSTKKSPEQNCLKLERWKVFSASWNHKRFTIDGRRHHLDLEISFSAEPTTAAANEALNTVERYLISRGAKEAVLSAVNVVQAFTAQQVHAKQ